MSSFYGGKQGRTYHIVQRYESVADMVQAFSDGGAYTDANYGQYVIIDTRSKDNPENGLLFRRGFDYNDTPTSKPNYQDYLDEYGVLIQDAWYSAWMGWVNHVGAGAIYVGQIVGPKGDAAQVIPVDWDEIEVDSRKVIPVSRTLGNDDTQVLDNDGNTIWNGDAIKVASVTVKDSYGSITGAKIAFDIPINVLQTQIVNSNPYSTAGIVEDSSTTEHPFWYKWNFTIPSGKHGQDIDKLVKETGEVIGVGEEDGEGNPIVSDDEYITYSVKNYDVGNDGDSDAAAAIQTDHLGRWPYRVINNISLVNKDRVIVSWQDGYQAQVGDLYRNDNYLPDYYWVCVVPGTISSTPLDDIVIDESTGRISYDLGFQDSNKGGTWRVVTIPQTAPAHSLIVDYKAGEDDQFVNQLRNLDYLAVDNTGKVFAFYSDQEQPYYLTNIGGLDKVNLTDSEIVFVYKDGSQKPYPLKQILSIDFYVGNPQRNPSTGEWILDVNGKPTFDSYSQDSILKIRYKDGTQTQFRVNRIEQVSYDNNYNNSQYFNVKYLGDESKTPISDPINTVLAFDRFGSDNIYILYSDPSVRNNIPNSKVKIEDWTDPVTGTTYSGLRWYNFGPLGAQYHVQGEYTLSDLKTTLVNGFDSISGLEDRAGWLVTVTEIRQGQEQEQEDNIIPHIYAFDYNDDRSNPSHQLYDGTASCWYQIMSLSESAMDPKRVVQIAETTNDLEKVETLQEGMLWFVTSVGHDNYQDDTNNIVHTGG